MFQAAERDLLTLQGMTASVPEEAFGFHVQQAAEKSFKAWLALRGETYPLTHNLELLLDRLADQGVATKPFQQLIGYTPYAVEFRYEVSAPVLRRLIGRGYSRSSKYCSDGFGGNSQRRRRKGILRKRADLTGISLVFKVRRG